MTRLTIPLTAALLLATLTFGWAQQTLRPGQYAMTLEMQLPGTTTPMTLEETDCITAEDARDFQALMMEQMAGVDECTFSNVVTAGNKITWDTMCEDSTASTELSFVAGGFDAVVRMNVAGEIFTSRMKARWIGAACLAEEEP